MNDLKFSRFERIKGLLFQTFVFYFIDSFWNEVLSFAKVVVYNKMAVLIMIVLPVLVARLKQCNIQHEGVRP